MTALDAQDWPSQVTLESAKQPLDVAVVLVHRTAPRRPSHLPGGSLAKLATTVQVAVTAADVVQSIRSQHG